MVRFVYSLIPTIGFVSVKMWVLLMYVGIYMWSHVSSFLCLPFAFVLKNSFYFFYNIKASGLPTSFKKKVLTITMQEDSNKLM